MLSIIVVHHGSYPLLNLLIESIERFTDNDYDTIIIDNNPFSRQRVEKYHFHQFFMGENIGLGNAVNLGIQKVIKLFSSNPFVMIIDSDIHFLKHHWDKQFLDNIENFEAIIPNTIQKRPACWFIRKEVAIQYNWETNNYQKMLNNKIKFTFLRSFPNSYGTHSGEELGFQEPLLYHHWQGDKKNDETNVVNQVPWRVL